MTLFSTNSKMMEFIRVPWHYCQNHRQRQHHRQLLQRNLNAFSQIAFFLRFFVAINLIHLDFLYTHHRFHSCTEHYLIELEECCYLIPYYFDLNTEKSFSPNIQNRMVCGEWWGLYNLWAFRKLLCDRVIHE